MDGVWSIPRAQNDRRLIVTRERYSHRVLAAMRAWVEEDRCSPARPA